MRGSRNRPVGLLVAAVAAIGILGAACAPAPAPPPPAANCPSGPENAIVSTVYNRVNADRGGLGALAWNGQLACNARDWAGHMAATNSLVHQNLGNLIQSAGYENFASLGENILSGPGSMDGNAIHDAWMSSPTHRANVMGAFDSIGIAIAYGGDGRLWATEEFGRHF